MWFDSHSHLTDERFDETRDSLIASFKQENIGHALDIGTNFFDSQKAIENACKYPEIYCAVGIHPDSVNDLKDGFQDELKRLALSSKKVVAIGEIGLDYYWHDDNKEIQKKRFIEQIEVARELNLPIIIHDRDAHKDCLDIVKEYAKGMTGVFHCYSGSYEMAKEILKCGFYISFAGPITFKNEKKLKEMAPKLPLDRILVETDSPYLAPVPFRGKTNCPIYVKHTGEMVALCRGEEVSVVENATYNNALKLFGIEE